MITIKYFVKANDTASNIPKSIKYQNRINANAFRLNKLSIFGCRLLRWVSEARATEIWCTSGPAAGLVP